MRACTTSTSRTWVASTSSRTVRRPTAISRTWRSRSACRSLCLRRSRRQLASGRSRLVTLNLPPADASPARTEHGTDATVLLFLEHPVALRPVLEWHDVGGEVLGLHLVTAHAFEDLRDVAVPVLLGAAQGQRLVHHRTQGELVHEAGEDTEGEHRPALAAGGDRPAHPP